MFHICIGLLFNATFWCFGVAVAMANTKLKQENQELKEKVKALSTENKALKDEQSEMQERVGDGTHIHKYICTFALLAPGI